MYVAVASCFATGAALGNPTGHTVVNGTATFREAGNVLKVTNSPNAVINWQSFSIGANEVTRFIQQSQSSTVLNRVTGSAGTIDPSVILGSLRSNGRVYLLNPSGVVFGEGSTVNVAGMEIENLDREGLRESLLADALAAYDRREGEFGDEIMRQLERAILLQIIDNRWREHLYEMDYLREGIHLRGFAQIDPLVAYKNEGFSMFEALMHSIWEEFARLIFHVEVEVAPQAQNEFAPAPQIGGFDYSGGTAVQPSALNEAAVAMASGADAAAEQAIESRPGNGDGDGFQEQETVVKDEKDKIGRNDPCWCGSGKKYKKCHGA